MINLDRYAAETSQEILNNIDKPVKDGVLLKAKDLERIATDSLGVLQEQGLYAFFLYLLSKSGEKTQENELSSEEFGSCVIMAKLLNLLNRPELKSLDSAFANGWDESPPKLNICKKDILGHISGHIAADLKCLLLVKSLFEQVLIYTRYGAKALTSAVEAS
ncbi:MAG: hypothetical protein QME63_06525 [Actinomycetota bacterium]|nr:hypothetical protein [Actinomycetota bacterium]